jgi:hypothetical protein
MEGIATIGQLISDDPKKVIDDIQAQIRARKSTAMKLAHERKPKWFSKKWHKNGSSKKRRTGWTYYKRKKLGEKLKRMYANGEIIKRGRASYKLTDSELMKSDMKKISAINQELVAPIKHKTLMEMVADRVAEGLLKKITKNADI